MVNWPCIIKHSDDAELIYIHDKHGWDSDADLRCFEYDEGDVLIDATGNVYSLTTAENAYIHPEPRGETMGLKDILGLVKAHASHKGSCCVAKLYAPTVLEAFKIVESLDE